MKFILRGSTFFSMLAVLLIFNPLLLLGCFSCPGYRTIDTNRFPGIIDRVSTHAFVASNDEGMVEYRVTDITIDPRTHGPVASIDWVKSSFAAACNVPPRTLTFPIEATLKVTWIPADGTEQIVLFERNTTGRLIAPNVPEEDKSKLESTIEIGLSTANFSFQTDNLELIESDFSHGGVLITSEGSQVTNYSVL